MFEYFSGLEAIDKVFFVSASVGGLLFIIRTIMMFLGGHDFDVDTDMDVHFDGSMDHGGDSDTSFKFLTFQGITVFFMMFGLVGLCFHQEVGLNNVISILGGSIAGIFAVLVIDKIMTQISRLQSSGTINMNSAVGQVGTVYLTIHPESPGKVQVSVQGRLMTLDAMSLNKEEIKTSERVTVVEVVNNTVVVEKK